MRCRPFVDAAGLKSGQGDVVAVMRDVTVRKMQEQALNDARAQAEQADVSKSRFLATMSHELRTPLNAIIGFSEMLTKESELSLDPARRVEYAQLINDSGQHLLSVVNDILDMSKMESGTFEISSEPFAPRAAINACCDLMALKARDGGIDLIKRVPDNLPEMTGDQRAFKQILINLLSNAIKFTERGGKVIVSTAIRSGRMVLTVEDTGVGIHVDDLKRLGDAFFQAGKTYQRRHEGTGLGLSIVKGLVALHQGEMSIESRLGEGTSVSIALPLIPDETRANSTITPLPARDVSQPYQVKKSA
jgi:cell cycle sensor histidine kinase DivJ